MNKIRRRVVAIVMLTAIFAPLSVGVPFAQADHSGVTVRNYSSSYVAMRYAPTSVVNVKVRVPNGTSFRMTCWLWGQTFTGNYRSAKWFYGQEYSRGSWGYIHSSYVLNQITVPRC